MNKLSLVFFNIFLILSTQAQQNPAQILHEIKKLQVNATVLYIAAHPDDENTRLLGYLANERKYRTAYLSLTRGDGGQNLIGNEQGISLGYIRTHELWAARKIDGAEQYFSRAYDFGFSKTPEETLKIWDKQKVLSDIVYLIRYLKPDIIICRFPTTGEGGHGHHTSSAILAEEAFEISGDATKFPDHFPDVWPYKAKRLMWNTFNFNGNNTQRDDQLKIDVGNYNALIGKSYGEIAAESRSQHKSQGFGVPIQRGKSIEYFKRLKGDEMKVDIMDGVDVGIEKLLGKSYTQLLDSVINNFNINEPSDNLDGVLRLYDILKNADINTDLKLFYQTKINSIISNLVGLYIESTCSKKNISVTDEVPITTTVIKRLNNNVTINKIKFFNKNEFLGEVKSDTVWNLTTDQNLVIKQSFPTLGKIHQPYWLKEEMNIGNFNIPFFKYLTKAIDDADITCYVTVTIKDRTFVIYTPVVYKFTDPVKGELKQPLNLINIVSIKFNKDVLINSKKLNPITATISNLTNNKIQGKISIREDGLKAIYNSDLITIDSGANYSINIFLKSITATSKKITAYWYDVNNNLKGDNHTETIEYDHIPNLLYHKPTEIKIVHTDVKIIGKKVGYIMGAGDKVADILKEMGYDVTIINEANINEISLLQFNSIITGVRAYNVHSWLSSSYDKLMNYVQQGGNFLIQYNTSNQIGPVKSKMTPFNFNISRTRVTDEKALIKFINPTHPLLNTPNILKPTDFEGWVQERSIYQAEKYDSIFKPIIIMNDLNEKETDGSLITANYGKGRITYTGLALFRQLPAGVPSAIKLMANLLSNGK